MNEAQIITGLRACSAEAHEALYDEYAGDLYDYCRALLGDDAAAAAALRETLLRAAESTGSMPTGCALRAWLFALARSQCRRGGDRLIEHPMPDDDPSARLLVAVLGTLTPRDREVLELTGRHGLTEEDLEPVLGLPDDRVASLVADARRRFDHAMAEELDHTGPVAFPSLAGLTPGTDPLPLLYTALPMATPPPRTRPQTLDDLLIAATTAHPSTSRPTRQDARGPFDPTVEAEDAPESVAEAPRDASDPLADTVTGMPAYGAWSGGVDPFREAFGGGSFDAFGAADREAVPPALDVDVPHGERDLPDGDDAAAGGGGDDGDGRGGPAGGGAAGGGGGHRRGRSRRRAALVGVAAGVVVVAAGIAFAVGTAGGGQNRTQAASRPSNPGQSTVDATNRPASSPTQHATDPRHRSAPGATPTPSTTDTARNDHPGSRTHDTGGSAHRPAHLGQGHQGATSSEPPPTHGHRPPSSTSPATSRPPTRSPSPSPTPTSPTPAPTTDSAAPSGSTTPAG